jgi:membrane-associated phospholipid phosphatase
MRLLCVSLLALPLLSQTQEKAPAPTVLDVKPGEKAIKNKDIWEGTGVFHPFRRMPRFIVQDQVKIWTSPFHTSSRDAKWWGIFGFATAALIATDQFSSKALPNSNDQVLAGKYVSNIGAAYTLVPLSAAFYFIGTASKTEHFRETGLLSFETLINSTLVEVVIKAATRRERPLEGDGKGHFWAANGSALNASFPSGHATNTFALASIFAHQYHNHIAVPIVAYSLAGLVVGARIAAQKHFPGDVVPGAAMGWFIGDYVYGRRHNPSLDEKRPISYRLMDHFRLGPAYPVGPAAIVEIRDGAVLASRP